MLSKARVRNLELAYETAGTGAPVVLLHGFPFNRSLWREQVEALGHAQRVIAPDLRGFGATTATNEPATMETYAADVCALLDELELERVVLGGLSMGGYVALAFYRRYPERVRALILADTRPQADTEEARRTRELQAQRALAAGMQEIAEAMLPKLLTRATRANRPEIVARVREMILSISPVGAAAALRGLALRRDQTDLLAEINVPTLIMVGNEDEITPPFVAEQMQRAIRGSQLEVVEGASHCANLERADEFNHALINFLSTLPT
jgi:3-oxoadipate enol-lactonase